MTTTNKIKLAAAIIGLILIIIVILQNMEEVTTQFLFASIDMPRSALLILTLLIGFGSGMLTSWVLATRKKKN